MKKRLLLPMIGCVFAVMPTHADTLAGLYLGAQGWDMGSKGGFADSASLNNYSFDSETNSSLYIAFEHGVPLIPNIKINRTTMDARGDTRLTSDVTFQGQTYTATTDVMNNSELTTTDFILYYELFDNDLVSFDLGINGKYVDGTLGLSAPSASLSSQTSYSAVIPMLYSKVQVGVPFSGWSAYAEGSYLSLNDSTLSDLQIALTYAFIDSLAVDMSAQLGYRKVKVDVEDIDNIYTNLEFDGIFAGIELHF